MPAPASPMIGYFTHPSLPHNQCALKQRHLTFSWLSLANDQSAASALGALGLTYHTISVHPPVSVSHHFRWCLPSAPIWSRSLPKHSRPCTPHISRLTLSLPIRPAKLLYRTLQPARPPPLGGRPTTESDSCISPSSINRQLGHVLGALATRHTGYRSKPVLRKDWRRWRCDPRTPAGRTSRLRSLAVLCVL